MSHPASLATHTPPTIRQPMPCRSSRRQARVPLTVLLLGALCGPGVLAAQKVERVSVADRVVADNYSFIPSISSNGRFVVFSSAAENLVPGDTNAALDVFVRDRKSGLVRRVSVDSEGNQGNSQSYPGRISANGRVVVFYSHADNLVLGDDNGASDAFVYDLKNGETTRIEGNASSQDGSAPPAVSAKGDLVAFRSKSTDLVLGDTNGQYDIFVHDRKKGQTTRVSVASDGTQTILSSSEPEISANGRLVVFVSQDNTLVPGDTGYDQDVFAHDRTSGQTVLVSAAHDGGPGNGDSGGHSISANGRFIAFSSKANNLVPGDSNGVDDVFVRDLKTGVTTRVSSGLGGVEGNAYSSAPSISANGRFVAYSSLASNLVVGDTNGVTDVFVHDRKSGETSLVSVASDGAQGDDNSGSAEISGNGRLVCFQSNASNLVPGNSKGVYPIDVLVHDRATGETTRQSISGPDAQANNSSDAASLSANGRLVAFSSQATDLLPEDLTESGLDGFVRDRKTGRTRLISVSSEGVQADSSCFNTTLSPNGRVAGFSSAASNLTPGGSGGETQIFVHTLKSGKTERITTGIDGLPGNESSVEPTFSANGRVVAFTSYASNLVPDDTKGYGDIFVHDRKAGKATRVSLGVDGTGGDGHSSAPSISSNGRVVAFQSNADNLVPGGTTGGAHIFVHDLKSGATTLVSKSSDGVPGDDFSEGAVISGNGQVVAFSTRSTNLVPGVTDGQYQIYVADLKSGETSVISVGSGGVAGNDHSSHPTISANGRLVAFTSGADNLVPGDTNGEDDIFLHDRVTGQTVRISEGEGGTQGTGACREPALSSNGRVVVFRSTDSNLVVGDSNGQIDLLARELK